MSNACVLYSIPDLSPRTTVSSKVIHVWGPVVRPTYDSVPEVIAYGFAGLNRILPE